MKIYSLSLLCLYSIFLRVRFVCKKNFCGQKITTPSFYSWETFIKWPSTHKVTMLATEFCFPWFHTIKLCINKTFVKLLKLNFSFSSFVKWWCFFAFSFPDTSLHGLVLSFTGSCKLACSQWETYFECIHVVHWLPQSPDWWPTCLGTSPNCIPGR